MKDCVFLANSSTIWGGAVSTNGGIVLFEGNTVVGNTGGLAGAAVSLSSAAVVRNNVIASTSGSGAALSAPSDAASGCNVFWNNPAGDFVSYVPDSTDAFVDPLFCDEAAGDIRLSANSPCLPENSNGCDLIGALGQGCGTVSVTPSTWGRIKTLYRE